MCFIYNLGSISQAGKRAFQAAKRDERQSSFDPGTSKHDTVGRQRWTPNRAKLPFAESKLRGSVTLAGQPYIDVPQPIPERLRAE